MKKYIVLFTGLFLFSLTNLFAQSTSPESNTEEYNRWSGSLHAGYIFGERDRGLQIFSSRFNVVSEPSWAVGGDIRYALNSFWSIEGGYRYSTYTGVGFETTMHTASVKNTFNLNRFYRRSTLSEYVNPFLILGVEQDFFDAQGLDDEFSRSEASLIGGLGVAFRLSNRFEIFGQHEIKLSSNYIDLQDRGYPYDQIGMTSGGVRVYFGSSNKKPINLKPATKSLTYREYDDIFARVESSEITSDDRHIDNDKKFNELNDRIAALEARVDSLEAKTDCLCQMNEASSSVEEPEQETERELRRSIAAGHYVQVFASSDYERAYNVRQQFRELLSEYLDDPEDEVFMIQRRQFYEVLIGVFNQFGNTQRILTPAASVMSDAFVITFPRPIHLSEQYEGTVIVHD